MKQIQYTKTMRVIFSILMIVFFMSLPFVHVSAIEVGLPNPICPQDNPNCERSDVPGLLKSIVNWLIEIGAIVAVGMVIWGAFQMMFAGGDPEKFKTGRNTIFYTVVGYAILLIGWGITAIVKELLTTSSQ